MPARILGPQGWFQRKLPWIFLTYALPAVAFLCFAMPPFQVTDELAHTLRADQIALGGLVSPRLGGEVHADLVDLGGMYRSMWFHPEVKQTVELARRAGAIRWTPSLTSENFQNTAQYGPFLYLPQALGLSLGRWADLSAAQSLVLARLLNGLSACTLGFLALRTCRRGRALMFATLVLPMTLSEFGSASQDALIIGLSLLAIAVGSRLLSPRRPASAAEFALFVAAVVTTTLARPSQVALGLLGPVFVARPDPGWGAKLAMALPGAVLVIAWLYLLRLLMPPVPSHWSVSGQFEHLLAHPLALPAAMMQTFATHGRHLFGSLVGHLGWLDAPMPVWFVRLAGLGLVLALLAPERRGGSVLPGLAGVSTFLALLTSTCFALYLSWTPVAHPTIDGLQGRYLLPVLPLLAWAVPAQGADLERVLMPAWGFVVAFPLVSLATLPPVIMARYYGTWEVMAEAVRALVLP